MAEGVEAVKGVLDAELGLERGGLGFELLEVGDRAGRRRLPSAALGTGPAVWMRSEPWVWPTPLPEGSSSRDELARDQLVVDCVFEGLGVGGESPAAG